ncbi:MAG: hypothetical protein LBL31_04805 [Spirochaetaceae bacterium]|jgi:hypothetical protein|nr:hypothetical protein [Spirochaetaceae bacterium]
MNKLPLVTYSILDNVYANPSLNFLRGLRNASAAKPTVGTIENPRDTLVRMRPSDTDPKMFSYVYHAEVRMLLSKVVTPVSGTAPQTTWSLLGLPKPPYGAWAILAENIILQYPDGTAVATNAYGVAQVGNWLYIIDYDSQKIYILDVNELNGLPSGSAYTLTQAPYDLGPDTDADLPDTAKGQAIIAEQDGAGNPYLFALFIDANSTATQHDPGHLVRVKVNAATGALTYDIQCDTGLNPQEIVLLTKSNKTVSVAVPSAGGAQQAGATNTTYSRIDTVPAFAASWTPTTLVTGDPAGAGTFDIFAIAAPDRVDSNGIVYVLTHDYNADYSGTDWILYSTTVAGLLSLVSVTLTQATQAGILTVVESGTDAPGYFWNLLFETGANADNDRLWFFRGTPLLVTPALAYAAPPQSGELNKFCDIGTDEGDIGGASVDWADLTVEASRQAALGKSLKHSVRASKPPAAATEEEEK